ncbi:MAG: RDD family protein [Sphingomonadaceae bacterium]|nr:RDD family protein [Sphingomonadaceae bacterium]
MASASPSLSPDSSVQRTLVTPEGVDLRLRLGTAGQRAGAFVIDFLLLILTLILFMILLFWAGLGAAEGRSNDGLSVVAIIWLLGFFLLRNFYFIAFEIGRRSATLGKRIFGMRVVARDGGRLTADAVIARNLMREIEVFLPITFLFSGGIDTGSALMAVVGCLWATIFLFFPLFNKDRLRVGDIIAGTWVVHAPRRKLLADLAGEGSNRLPDFDFTDEQLAVYGEYELQTLEKVLRDDNAETLHGVANTIRAKIDWHDGDDDYIFLNAYYAALVARLERGMLFGKRRASKFDIGEDQSSG